MQSRHLHLVGSYSVRIDYREPTYEAHVGQKNRPFSWTYEIVAGSEEEAAKAALRQFHDTTKVSSVGWIREVVEVRVVPSVA